jgi:serine/threonine-protein kinase RsbW
MQSTLVLPSVLTRMDEARRWAGDHAREAGYDAETVFAVELALTETLSNVIRHAYSGEEEHEIQLDLDADTDAITLRITDWGKRFDFGAFEPEDLDVARDGGYGIHLIRTLMDEVTYDTSAQVGTSVSLVRYRERPDGDARAQ